MVVVEIDDGCGADGMVMMMEGVVTMVVVAWVPATAVGRLSLAGRAVPRRATSQYHQPP